MKKLQTVINESRLDDLSGLCGGREGGEGKLNKSEVVD